MLKEYKGFSASKAEYYYANGQILARKMFGCKGSILPDREPGLANGGTYYGFVTDPATTTDIVAPSAAPRKPISADDASVLSNLFKPIENMFK